MRLFVIFATLFLVVSTHGVAIVSRQLGGLLGALLTPPPVPAPPAAPSVPAPNASASASPPISQPTAKPASKPKPSTCKLPKHPATSLNSNFTISVFEKSSGKNLGNISVDGKGTALTTHTTPSVFGLDKNALILPIMGKTSSQCTIYSAPHVAGLGEMFCGASKDEKAQLKLTVEEECLPGAVGPSFVLSPVKPFSHICVVKEEPKVPRALDFAIDPCNELTKNENLYEEAEVVLIAEKVK